jgi:hypothetical protein
MEDNCPFHLFPYLTPPMAPVGEEENRRYITQKKGYGFRCLKSSRKLRGVYRRVLNVARAQAPGLLLTRRQA